MVPFTIYHKNVITHFYDDKAKNHYHAPRMIYSWTSKEYEGMDYPDHETIETHILAPWGSKLEEDDYGELLLYIPYHDNGISARSAIAYLTLEEDSWGRHTWDASPESRLMLEKKQTVH